MELLEMTEVIFIPFKKSLYDDLIRYSDGAIDPADLAVAKVESWIDFNFALGPDGMDDSFDRLFGDRLLDFAAEYAPHFVTEMQQRGDAQIQAILESRTPLVWKEVTVPAGSEVRMIYAGKHFYGTIKNGRIADDDGEFSPSSWTYKITRTARNAWRDLWFKFPGNADWVQADMLRQRARRTMREEAGSNE
jgi:hypothetical protein